MSAVVGIDLGGTKVAAAELRGRTLGECHQQPTELAGAAKLLDQLVAMVESVGTGSDAVGIGVPSVVEFATGRVVSSINIPLADVPIRQVLGERLGIPVFVDNDATVAAFAEAHDENLGLTAPNLVMLTIGTGVGGGIVLDGRIYRGSTGGAGELGIRWSGWTSPARCPRRWLPPAGVARVRRRRACARPRSPRRPRPCTRSRALGGLRADGQPVLGADAVRAAHDGDPAASGSSRSGVSASGSASRTRSTRSTPRRS